jgi:hydrogenase maturation protease
MSSLPTTKQFGAGGTCIVGLGGDFGDDRLGWWVVDRLAAAITNPYAPDVRLVGASNPADLFAMMEGIHELIVIDACQGLGEAGEVLRLVWPTKQIAKLRHPFGHNITLEEVFDLATRLGQLPDVCEVWCIEGGQFGFGQSLSPEVEAAGRRVVSEIAARLNAVGSYA